MPLADTARVLTKVSGLTITEEMLRDDVLQGAPTNADGTLNLVHFVAWQIREIGRGD